MEDLKDELQRLLLRQMNDILMRQDMRTAGRTLHTERARLNAFRPLRIVEANMVTLNQQHDLHQLLTKQDEVLLQQGYNKHRN